MDFFISSDGGGGSSSPGGGSSSGGGGGSTLSGGGRVYDSSGNGVYYDKDGWHFPVIPAGPSGTTYYEGIGIPGMVTSLATSADQKSYLADMLTGNKPWEPLWTQGALTRDAYFQQYGDKIDPNILATYTAQQQSSPTQGLLPPMPANPPPSEPVAPPAPTSPTEAAIPIAPSVAETPLTHPVKTLPSDWKFDKSGLMSGLINTIGGLWMEDIPGVPKYDPVTAPTFPQLNTKQADGQNLSGESQSMFPWQRSASVKPVDATTEYLRNYQQDFAPKAGLLSSKNNAQRNDEWNALPTLDSYSLAQNKANVPDLAVNNQQPPKVETGNYIDDYIKSNRDNLTKGMWQAYA